MQRRGETCEKREKFIAMGEPLCSQGKNAGMGLRFWIVGKKGRGLIERESGGVDGKTYSFVV